MELNYRSHSVENKAIIKIAVKNVFNEIIFEEI